MKREAALSLSDFSQALPWRLRQIGGGRACSAGKGALREKLLPLWDTAVYRAFLILIIFCFTWPNGSEIFLYKKPFFSLLSQ